MDKDHSRALIASALIASGQFKLADFAYNGTLKTPTSGQQPPSAGDLIAMGQNLYNRRKEWSNIPMLQGLRQLTDAIQYALNDPSTSGEGRT